MRDSNRTQSGAGQVRNQFSEFSFQDTPNRRGIAKLDPSVSQSLKPNSVFQRCIESLDRMDKPRLEDSGGMEGSKSKYFDNLSLSSMKSIPMEISPSGRPNPSSDFASEKRSFQTDLDQGHEPKRPRVDDVIFRAEHQRTIREFSQEGEFDFENTANPAGRIDNHQRKFSKRHQAVPTEEKWVTRMKAYASERRASRKPITVHYTPDDDPEE